MEDFKDRITFEFSCENRGDVIITLEGKVLSDTIRWKEIAVYTSRVFIEAMKTCDLDNIIIDGICCGGYGMKLDEKRRNELFGNNENISVINYH